MWVRAKSQTGAGERSHPELKIAGWVDLLDTGRKLNVSKTSEDVQDVFWTSYVRSIYVLCLWGTARVGKWCFWEKSDF